MRKVVLSPDDFDLFNTDITFAEFEFIHKHWEAFRRMWKEQGQKYWIRFVMTYRNYATVHGAIRDIANVNDKYQSLIDETFIFLHENFIEGKYRDAKNLLEELLVLAQNKGMIQFLGSKSFARDPFYNKDTRDCFRHLFGPPTEKVSYVKVCVIHDLYTRFGGAVFKCLKRWLEADEVPPGSEETWDPMVPTALPKPSAKLTELCFECHHELGCEPTRQFSNNSLVTYMMEKRSGHPCGPWFVRGWKLHEDPRYHDKNNPLYDISQDPEIDWRKDLSFNKFSGFLEYVKQYYPTDIKADVIDPDAENDPEVMELWKRMFGAGIGDNVLDTLSTTDQVGVENWIKMIELQDEMKKEQAKNTTTTTTTTKSEFVTAKPKKEVSVKPDSAKISAPAKSQSVTGDDGKKTYTIGGQQVTEPVTTDQKLQVGEEAKASIQEILGLSDGAMHIRVNTHHPDGSTKVAFQTHWDAQMKDFVGGLDTGQAAKGEGAMSNMDMDMMKDALKNVLGALASDQPLPETTSQMGKELKLLGVIPNEPMKELLQAKTNKSKSSDNANASSKTQSDCTVGVSGEKLIEEIEMLATSLTDQFDVTTPYGRKMEDLCNRADDGDIFARLKIDRILMGGEQVSDTEESATDKTVTTASGSAAAESSEKPKRRLKSCFNCNKEELVHRTFKKCQICKEQKISKARYYCGRECQVVDWKAKHKMEHKMNLIT